MTDGTVETFNGAGKQRVSNQVPQADSSRSTMAANLKAQIDEVLADGRSLSTAWTSSGMA